MNVLQRAFRASAERPPSADVPPRVRAFARAADYALEGAAVGLMIVVAVGLSLYAGRRALVGGLAEDYLRQRGVEAEVEVYDVDSRGFVGRVRLGPENDPDFVAERVVVGLAAPPPPEGPYALRPRVIRIMRPDLKARWTGEKLSFGSLDPLVEEFLSRPPEPDKPSPLVIVDQGTLRLATPYGPLRAGGSGVLDDSKLRRLDLAVQPADLRGGGFTAALGGATIRASSDGQRVQFTARADLRRLQQGDLDLRSGALTVGGTAPYPDMETRRLRGPLTLQGGLDAADARAGDAAASGLALTFRLNGDAAGPLDRITVRGAGAGSLEADRFTAGALTAQAPAATFRSRALVLAAGPAGLEGSGALSGSASARSLAAGDLRGETLAADFSTGVLGFNGGGDVSGRADVAFSAGRVAAGPDLSASDLTGRLQTDLALLKGRSAPVSGTAAAAAMRIAVADTPVTARNARATFSGAAGGGAMALQASLRGEAGVPAAAARRLVGDLPVIGAEAGYAAALARAASSFSLDAPGLGLAQTGGRTRVSLTRPATLRGAGGVVAELRPVAGRPVWAEGQGGVELALHGGGAPQIDARIDRYALTPGGFDADLRLRTSLDLAIARGAVLQARGRAVSRGGVFEFRPAECATFTAREVELGENDLQALSTRVCPQPGATLLRADAGGYRVGGRFEQTSVAVPFLETQLTAGAGTVDAAGGEAGLTAVTARIDAGEADDTAAVRRYHPVALTGTAVLSGGDWEADLTVLDAPGGAALATADLAHDVESGAGRVLINADELRFTPEGLQPHDLTPLAVGMMSKVDGAVDFTGQVAWTEGAEPTSGGRLTTEGLSFDSPAGRVVGFGPGLTLSSLTPLIAPPGQVVRAERVEAFSPLENPEVRFGLTPTTLQIEAATAGFAGGRVTLEPLALALEGERVVAGAVQLDDVDIGRLIEASGFGDKVEFLAVVDGRVPFESGPQGLRFEDGALHSVRPGRLSIDRDVLSGVQASGGPEVVAPDAEAAADAPPPPAQASAFQDLAYDALENLAYEQMEVAVDTRPGGRLGMVFKVRGEYDPAVAQEARISILDLLRGQAFNKDIPLPKGTPVNLTLDTSINFDELLASYLEFNRAREERSDPVQRPGG